MPPKTITLGQDRLVAVPAKPWGDIKGVVFVSIGLCRKSAGGKVEGEGWETDLQQNGKTRKAHQTAAAAAAHSGELSGAKGDMGQRRLALSGLGYSAAVLLAMRAVPGD